MDSSNVKAERFERASVNTPDNRVLRYLARQLRMVH